MSKRKTTEEFISQAITIHNNKYDYTNTVYTIGSEKVSILCNIHGEFQQRASAHLLGQTCPKCSKDLERSTTEEFITKSKKIHGDKYEYSEVVYVSANKDKVWITCPKHGQFQQSPSKHLTGRGCPQCANELLSGAVPKSTTAFIKDAKEVHGDKYTYEKANYRHSHKKVVVTCPTHGDFLQTPSLHLQGCGCSNCASYGFQPNKSGTLYYLKVEGQKGETLFKIGITNNSVKERFNNTDLKKIKILEQHHYAEGSEALLQETKLKQKYVRYQYKGPNVLSSGNTELFTEDILKLYYKDNEKL